MRITPKLQTLRVPECNARLVQTGNHHVRGGCYAVSRTAVTRKLSFQMPGAPMSDLKIGGSLKAQYMKQDCKTIHPGIQNQ